MNLSFKTKTKCRQYDAHFLSIVVYESMLAIEILLMFSFRLDFGPRRKQENKVSRNFFLFKHLDFSCALEFKFDKW